MDKTSKDKKLRAMNGYYKAQFPHKDVSIYLLVAIVLACSSFCFYPSWFPSLYSLTKEFILFLSVPDACFSIFSSKGLFVVVNVIVIFLVGEAKLVGSNSSYSASEIYSEYIERTRGISNLHEGKASQSKLEVTDMVEDKRVIGLQDHEPVEEQVAETSIEEEEDDDDEEFQEIEEEAQALEDDIQAQVTLAKEDEELEKERDREEEMEMPAEELNRRIEEFISRVNRQMWLEEARLLNSRLLVSCTA